MKTFTGGDIKRLIRASEDSRATVEEKEFLIEMLSLGMAREPVTDDDYRRASQLAAMNLHVEDSVFDRPKVGNQANPYLAGLELVKIHHGTSGQAGLAKCILSLYNDVHSYSIGEILSPLDSHYTDVVMDMIRAYARYGETEELRQAGKWCVENFPGLLEMSQAMYSARCEVRRKWDAEREAENRRLYPEEYT